MILKHLSKFSNPVSCCHMESCDFPCHKQLPSTHLSGDASWVIWVQYQLELRSGLDCHISIHWFVDYHYRPSSIVVISIGVLWSPETIFEQGVDTRLCVSILVDSSPWKCSQAVSPSIIPCFVNYKWNQDSENRHLPIQERVCKYQLRHWINKKNIGSWQLSWE